MPPGKVEAIKELLAEALRRPESERLNFLEARCEDRSTRMEVFRLLDLHTQAGDFLTVSIPEQMGAPVLGRELLAPGTALQSGRYEILQLLSEGGFATVYLAKDHAVAAKRVVVKLLDGVRFDPARRGAFASELKALSKLDHPNIVAIIDTGELNPRTPFLVLRYVPGLTLREVLRNGPLEPRRASRTVREIAKALSAAHRQDIWHLDLKPENVILSDPGTSEERVTVIDFGIAQFDGDEAGSARSVRYAPPDGRMGAQRDIYALAAVAFELFMGRLPERGLAVAGQLDGRVSRRSRTAICEALNSPAFTSIDAFAREFETPATPARLPVLAGAIACLVAAGGAIVLTLNRPGNTAPEASRPVPLITAEGFKYRPSFSPDGKWIFYTSGPEKHFDIYKKALAGGQPIPIVVGPENEDRPQCSPDGKTLAFLRYHTGSVSVGLVDLATGVQEELARVPDIDSFTWTPDGKALLISQGFPDEGTRRLMLLDLDSRSWKPFNPKAPRSRGEMRPAFSPNGRYLAFVRRWDQSAADLFVVKVDEKLNLLGEPKALTKHSDRIESVQWTPDGRSLLYVAGPLGEGNIWRVPAVGGERTPFLVAAQRIESIAIPKQEWKIAYSTRLSDTNIWRLDIGSPQAPPVKIIDGTYDDQIPHLSPDGRDIAFASDRSGDQQIWISAADGADPRKLTSFAGADAMDVVWTRDGTSLLVSIRSKALGNRVFRIPSAGGPALELIADGSATSVSRDGKWFYFARRHNGAKSRMWRAELASPKHPEPVTDGEAVFGMESPDGRSFFFAKADEDEGIWRKPLPEGEPRRIVETVARRSLFAPGKHGLYYAGAIPGSKQLALWYLPDTGGAPARLHTFERDLFWGFDLSPDERYLFYSQYDVNNADIMLVNEFR